MLVIALRLLLLDEPTAALDPRSQRWLEGLVQALVRGGTAVVMASHDIDAIRAMTSRAIVLGEDHRLLADGPTEAVLADRALLVRANLVA